MDRKKADIVFKNGVVYTVNPAQTWARAAAVKDNRIVCVGQDPDVDQFVNSDTEVINLDGKMLLPGFIDSHMHIFSGVTWASSANATSDSQAEVLEKLSAYAREHPELPFVRGFGWRHNAFGPQGPKKEDLDHIFPDRPAYILAMDGHSAWVNSAALQRAGISKDTPDVMPDFSFFERNESGEPTGTIRESPAMNMVLKRFERSGNAVIFKEVEKWLPNESQAGITALFDAGAFNLENQADGYGHLTELEKQGKLPVRVVGCYAVADIDLDPVPHAQEFKNRFDTELVQTPVLKVVLDGGVESYTAALLQPYNDRPEFCGELLMPPERLRDIVKRAHGAGLDMHVHAIGDRTTRIVLNAIETAQDEIGIKDQRHTICHLQLVDRCDIARFRRLGVIAQTTTIWATADPNWTDVTYPLIGERADNTYLMSSFFAEGVPVTFGSDWPASVYLSTYKPLDSIEIGITRKILGDSDCETLKPENERLTLPQMIQGHTINAAYQLRLEDRIGTIEVGKQADLIVLEKNLFEVPPHEIHATRVLLTMMNGNVTHRILE